MTARKPATKRAWRDPDDAPQWSEAMFDRADVYKGATLVRRGRPPVERPKVAVSIRLSADVVARFKATGAGWQTRIDAALAEWLGKSGA